MPNKIKVSGCIVTYNDFDKAINAVDSVLCQTKRVDFKLYISDNASKNNLCEKLQSKHPGISIIKNKTNVGFGKAHNKVIDLIDSDYHAIINPDIIVNSDVISDVCEYMEKNNIAVMATPKILSGDGTEQFLPRKRPKFKYMLAGRLPFLSKLRDEYTMKSSPVTEPAEIEFCTGCFMIIRTDVFKMLHGFDERFFMYMEDADLSRRASKFGKIVFLPQYTVTHLWERTSSKSLKYLLIHLVSSIKYFLKYLPYKENSK